MNLDELRSVQSKERQKDSLQNLRPSFYQEVGDYIADLEAERDRAAEQADNPFSSPEVSRLTDEIETAKDVVEAIYERRMGKLVKQASLAAAGMAANDEGLTAEEADLFDDLVDRIGSNKSRVLDVLEGVESEVAGGTEVDAADGADTETGPAAEAAGTEPAATPPTDGADPTRPDSNSSTPDTDPTAEDSIDGPGPVDEPGGQVDSTADDGPPVPPQEPPTDADSTAAVDESGADSDAGDSSGMTPADVMGGDGPTIEDEDDATAPTPPEDDPDMADTTPSEAGAGSSEPEGETDTTDVDRVTVKITRDVGSILGVDDREYSLSTDDIVTLPEQNATPLLEQEAAEPLE